MTKKPQEATPTPEIELWEQREVLVRDLAPFERNPRKNTKQDYERLKTSILKFGYNTPIKATQDLRIIGGHLRRRVLSDLGVEKIPVWIPRRALTDEEFYEILVRDNINNGGWDFDMLASDIDLDKLIDWGIPANMLGIDKAEPEEEKASNDVKKQEPITCPHCGAAFFPDK